MLKLKKSKIGIIFDWILFFIIFYIITDNLLIALYLSKTYSLFSHLLVILFSFLMSTKLINIYTIIFPHEIYLDYEKIYFKNFINKKEILLKDVKIHDRKKLILPFYKMHKIHYNKDAAFISKIRYKNHEAFILELNKRVNAVKKESDL